MTIKFPGDADADPGNPGGEAVAPCGPEAQVGTTLQRGRNG